MLCLGDLGGLVVVKGMRVLVPCGGGESQARHFLFYFTR